MQSKLILTVGLAAVSALQASAKEPVPSKQTKPNIILYLVDDLGWRDVGFMGSKYYETPNVDKMAKEGMVFTSAYANAPNCAPTRACLMSGLYTPRHGIYTVGNPNRGNSAKRQLIATPNKETLESKFVTMAEALKKSGYATCHVGKWHLGEGAETGPKGQGFDVNIAGNHTGSPAGGYFSPYKNPQLPDGPKGEYLTDRLTSEAINFIDDQNDDPFFMYFAHYAVHTPIQGKKEYIPHYASKSPDRGQDNPTYAAMIQSMDESLGRIIEKLEEKNMKDNTLIIFFSDNGGHGGTTSCRPLKGSKGCMYEGGFREPMIAWWPGKIEAGTTCDEPVIGIDFYPTFVELSGGKAKNYKLDGESLTNLFFQEGDLKRDAIYWHFPAYLQNYKGYKYPEELTKGFRSVPSGAIRKGDWKLIEDFEDGTLKLYDLKNDLSESTNLVKDNPQKTKELLKDLRKWRKQVKAPVPIERNPEYKKQ
ncbi:hypothetical protein EYV94_23760 [Puteibacter caeruleilacunae]|nr:hypothetical protein EYV94_23760 [Puteibacter caeruleilacunae]